MKRVHSCPDEVLSKSRRNFLKKAAMATAIAAAPPLLTTRMRAATGRTIKIGLPSPRTGPLAAFAEPEEFVMAGIRKYLEKGVVVNGVTHPVEVIIKDTRSSANRTAEVASSLIKADKVDLLIASGTPEIVNPTSDQAEINGVPSITTDGMWQQVARRGGKDIKTFNWNFHFFWGMEDMVTVFTGLWQALPTNKMIGVMWPNDIDGNGNADPVTGLVPQYRGLGFSLFDPGRFDAMSEDFTAQIAKFKQNNVEILTGAMSPPAFSSFWSQAAQQNFRPKVVTMAKAVLFPAAVNALGERAVGLTTEVWWSPHHPFKSSLTGESAAQLCEQWEKQTGKQWTCPIGFRHALIEVALDALKRTKNIDSPAAIRDAIQTTNLDTIVGHLQFGGPGSPTRNIAKTPLVGGQWVKGKKFKYDLMVVTNGGFSAIQPQVKMMPIPYS